MRLHPAHASTIYRITLGEQMPLVIPILHDGANRVLSRSSAARAPDLDYLHAAHLVRRLTFHGHGQRAASYIVTSFRQSFRSSNPTRLSIRVNAFGPITLWRISR